MFPTPWFELWYTISGLFLCTVLHVAPPVRGRSTLVFILASSFGLTAQFLLFADWISALRRATYALSINYAAMGTFTVLWRLSPFHPLAAFPGPIMCRISGLTLAYIVCTGKRHEIINNYHRRYGKFVRTGPTTLSINSNTAVSKIYANSAAFDKSDAYTLPQSQGRGFFFILEREEHNVRRNLWAPAFSRASLDTYMISLKRRTLQLCACIEERCDAGTGINLTELFQHWAYDIMGDITFGGANKLELMAEGDPERLIECGQSATMTLEVLGEVPWLFDILWNLPIAKDLHRLQKYAAKFAYNRTLDSGGSHDICGHLLGEYEGNRGSLNFDDLVLDTFFAGQAGSDTTASVMTFIFVYLLGHPPVLEYLRTELTAAFPDKDSIFDSNTLAKLPYLHAVIEESLRLGTPFPGLRRVTPPGGVVIDGRFVPGGTVVGVPGHAQQIEEENFSPDPLAFRPERWLNDELGTESVCRQSGLLSFSFGPFSCLGKQLAYQEMRAAVACIVLSFPRLQYSPVFDVDTFHKGVLNRKSTIFRHPLCVVANPKFERD